MVCGNTTGDSLMGWAEPQWQECLSAWSTLARSVRRTLSVTVTDCWIVPLNDRIVFSSVLVGNTVNHYQAVAEC